MFVGMPKGKVSDYHCIMQVAEMRELSTFLAARVSFGVETAGTGTEDKRESVPLNLPWPKG